MKLPVRIQCGFENMLSGFLFQLRTVRRFDRYAGVCGLYMVGDIVGMGAARGLWIVSQVFNDQWHVIGFARLCRTGDELIQSSGGVSRAVGDIRIHDDVRFCGEHRIVQPFPFEVRQRVAGGQTGILFLREFTVCSATLLSCLNGFPGINHLNAFLSGLLASEYS